MGRWSHRIRIAIAQRDAGHPLSTRMRTALKKHGREPDVNEDFDRCNGCGRIVNMITGEGCTCLTPETDEDDEDEVRSERRTAKPTTQPAAKRTTR
jgi:hypothetical protein